MNSTIAMQKIAELNLDQIKHKLMHAESGEGWSAQRADAIEVEYRRFLCMMYLYPEEHFAPLVDVDTFWHYHILDTRKYANDCQQAFGYFMHHHPYVGLGDDDAADHAAFGERMHALYQATFGEACLASVQAAGATAWCSLTNGADKGQTAWCSRVDGAKENQQTAWCSLSTTKANAQRTAWCSQSTQASAQKTAWCSRVDGGIGQQTAWCSGVETLQVKQTAWCSRVDSTSALATAWCSAPAA